MSSDVRDGTREEEEEEAGFCRDFCPPAAKRSERVVAGKEDNEDKDGKSVRRSGWMLSRLKDDINSTHQ